MRHSALWLWLLTCTFTVPLIGAEYVWPTDYSGDQAPAGWDLSAAANTTQQFRNGSISFKGPLTAFQTLSRAIGMDGNDRQPLVISAVINSEQPRELGGLPTFIALYWNPTHALFIGVGGMSEGLERYEPARRRGWAYWIIDGKIERRATERQLYSAEAPAHVRLLVSGNDISAAISNNGFSYETLASFARKDSVFAVAPERIIIGRGWFGEDAEKRQPLLANMANDPGLNEAVTSVISHVRISNEQNKLPRARLSAKATGFEDIRQEDLDRTTAEHWHLLGPLPNNDKEFGPERTRDTKNGFPLVPGHDLRWKPVTGEGPAARRSINLKSQLDMTQERQVALAITSIHCDAPRFERFWFDGARGIQVFVNGRLVADKTNGWESDIVPDRLAATTWLNRGENVVVLRLSAAWGGNCRFAFRHDAASPTQLIADHMQAIEAYHADLEGVVLATQEVSHWHEALGQRRLAAEFIGQALDLEDLTGKQVDTLAFARARLYRELRDEAALIATIEALAKRRLNDDDGDKPATRLNLVRLWNSMGFPDRAVRLAQELLNDKTLDSVTLTEAGFELARLSMLVGQSEAVPKQLQTLAERLPAYDPLRFPIALQAYVQDPTHDAKVVTTIAGNNSEQLAILIATNARLAEDANDPAKRIAALKHLSTIRNSETPWESLSAEIAEALAAAGDVASAITTYQQACTIHSHTPHPHATNAVQLAQKAGASGEAALNAWRLAFALVCLSDSPAGHHLLTQASHTIQPQSGDPLLSPVVSDWHVIGPFPNDNYSAYENPPVNVKQLDIKKSVGDKNWVRPAKDAYRDDVLDLARLFKTDNCVAFAYRSFSAALGEGELAIGSDDGLVVWFNGERVHEDRDNRAVLPGQIRIPVRFKAGTNTLLCMVQQGSGEWGLHVRINGANDDHALASVLNSFASSATSRERLAAAIKDIMATELSANRNEEAITLARLATRALADQAQAVIPIIDALITDQRDQPRPLTDAKAAVRWLLAMSQRRVLNNSASFVAALPERAANLLLHDADPAGAVDVLQQHMGLTLDATIHTRLLVELGDTFRLSGYPHQAAHYYRRVIDRPDASAAIVTRAQDGLIHVRGARSDSATFTTSLDAATLVATGDRALAANDATRAVRSYQRALDLYSTALIPDADGRVVGIPALVGERLRALDKDAAEMYRKLADRRANEALERAGNNLTELSQVANAYPATGAAALAYQRLGDALLVSGAGSHAYAVLQRLAAPTDSALAVMLSAKRAYAVELSGDRGAALSELDKLAVAHKGASLTVRGQMMPIADYVAERRAAVTAFTTSSNWPTAGGSVQRTGHAFSIPHFDGCHLQITLPVSLADRVEPLRFAPSTYRHLAMQPIVVDDIAYVDTGSDIIAINLTDGSLRWRSHNVVTNKISQEFSGNPDRTISIESGLVVSRVAQGDVHTIEARDAATGIVRWASATTLGAVNAISPPAVADGLVFAMFHDRDQRYRNTMAAFDLRTGQLRWRTALGDGVGNLVLATQQEIALGNHLAAPSVSGGVVYIATDMGSVVALEALTGRIEWVSHYQRARLDPQGSTAIIRRLANRAPRVLVDEQTIFIAPRDSLALLAIRRKDGALRWQHPLSDCSALYGFTTDGLVFAGDGITCVTRADGAVRWRWQPATDVTLVGGGLVNDKRVLVSTTTALISLSTHDGRPLAHQSWADLSNGIPVGNWIAAGQRLIAVGEDRLLMFAAGKKAPMTAQIAAPPAPALPVSGLPSLPFIAPVAVHWHLSATGSAQVHSNNNITCIDLGHRLVRMADDGRSVLWSSDQTSQIDGLITDAGVLLAIHERYLIARDPQTGNLLWSQPVLWDDCGFSLDQDERKHRTIERARIDVHAGLVLIRSAKSGLITVVDARTGQQRARFSISGNLLWCGLSHGFVIAARQQSDRLVIEKRSLDGVLVWSGNVDNGSKSVRTVTATFDANRQNLYVVGEHIVGAITLANPAILWSQVKDIGEYQTVRLSDKHLSIFSRRNNKQWVLQICSATDGRAVSEKQIAQDDRIDTLARPYFTGSRWITFSQGKQRETGDVVCQSDTLNEIWSVDLGSSKQRRHLVGRAAIGDTLVLITASDHNGACHWQTLALADGRVTGTGLVPGLFITEREQTVSATAVGNTLLCAIGDGVIGLSAIPNVAAPQNPITAAITLARTQTTQHGDGDTFLALYATPKAPALSTSSVMVVDGLLNDWKNTSTTALDAPKQHNKTANNARDIAGQIGIQWDANFVYVGLAIQDDIFQPPVPGAELRSGDSIVIGIDPEANDNPQSRPIVLALGLVNGQTQMVVVQGQSLNLNIDDPTTPTESANIMARLVRQADGYTGEIAIPWSMLRPNPRERPGQRSSLGLSALVFDHDGQKNQHASWGAGLAHAIDARRFARVICMDLTGERIAGYRRFIEQLPDHDFAWRFTERIAATHIGDAQLPAQITEIEQFITRAPNVPSTAAALATLVRFHRLAGHADPIAQTLSFAKRSKIPEATIGDGVGPQADGKGRALRQWVCIDPQNPPLALMVQMRSKQSDWNHRAYWGSDLMPWGQVNTSQRWPMGLLPETGKWVSLIIPAAAIGLNNVDIQNISFVSHSGNVRWGVSEWLDNGNVTTLVDPSTNPRFDRQIEFTTQDGRPSHGLKKQGGEAAYHLKDNSLSINLRREPTPPSRERLAQYAQAARLIANDNEAFELLRSAEALCEGEKREQQMIALYQEFLTAHPNTPQAGPILDHLRSNLEGWTNGRDPARRASAVERSEALMESAQLSRDARRQFHASYASHMSDWLSLGFFDPGRGVRNLGEALPIEKSTLDFSSVVRTTDQRDVRWHAVSGDSRSLHPGRALTGAVRQRYSICYATTRFEAPAAIDAYLYLGLRGHGAVWLNGKQIATGLGGEIELNRDTIVIPCKLQQGKNDLLIKLAERDGNPQLTCRIGDINGKPITGLINRVPASVIKSSVESPTRVTLMFNTVLDSASAEDLSNYSLDRDATINSVTLGKDKRSVTLNISPLTGNSDYFLRLGPIMNIVGTPMMPGTRLLLRPPSAQGDGLRAEFFTGRDLRELLVGRFDPVVDFTWADGEQPDPVVPTNDFSARWTGTVTPPNPGQWTFTVIADDGVRLWIDGKQIIDQWIDQAPTEASGSIEVKGKKTLDLRLEYYQGSSGKQIQLFWSSETTARTIIPSDRLSPPGADDKKKKN